MAGSSASDLEEFDDEYDSYSESVRQDGFLDELLERYTFTYDPAYCLKLRKSSRGVQLGLNLSRWNRSNHFCAVLKPDQGSWLRKVTLSSQPRRIEASTSKFRFGQELLTFALTAAYDIDSRKPRIGWKLSTRWSIGTYKIGRKEKFRLGPAAEFRPCWKLDYSAPEIEGEMGGNGEAMQVDQGHAHLSIPRMDLLLDIDKARQWCQSRFSRQKTESSLHQTAQDAAPEPASGVRQQSLACGEDS